MIVIGYHAVESLLHSSIPVKAVFVLQREAGRGSSLESIAAEKRIAWREFIAKDKPRFEAEFKRAGGTAQELESSQGIFAEIGEVPLKDHLLMLREAKKKEDFPVVLYLDSVTDPQNLGSILRSAAFFGVSGVVLTEHRSAAITPATLKISSGGFVHVPISRVTNLHRSLEEAKEEGFWVVGLSEHASESFDTARVDAPICLVIGNEETGIRALTEKTCDYTLSLPSRGGLNSLNAATAAAVALTLLRDRQEAAEGNNGDDEE
jgi:predicted rRNA methylase